MSGEQILVVDDSPTIARMVQLVLGRAGYRIEVAADGEAGLEAARRGRPDLILLDFMMPRLNGYQVCLELAADAELAQVPVVLMSARGDQVGDRFVKMMGIVDYVTKPFTPEGLADVVRRALAGARPGEAPAGALDAALAGADQPAPLLGGPRVAALARLRDALMDRMAQRLAARPQALAAGSLPALPLPEASEASEASEGSEGSSPARSAGEGEGLLDELRACLDDATLAQLLAEAEEVAGPDDLRGDLRVIPLTEILHLIAAHELSGLLQLERNDGRRLERIEVHLRRGKVEQALALGLSEELKLGRFVLDRELMEPARFEALAAAKPRGQLLGRALVERGHLAEAELRAVLARQSSELVYEALRWRTGTFRFRAGLELPAAALEAGLALSMDALIQDGCRRVDEWHLIERVIDSAQAVFARDDGVAQRGRSRLSREEQLVFDLLDGHSRVADLVRASRLGSFEVSRALYRLLSIKLARRAE